MKYCFFILCLLYSSYSSAQVPKALNDTIVLRDISIDKLVPAKMIELKIPSAGNQLQGFMYQATGSQPHPTIFLLHGFPGNERNLDLAQFLRARGWNVVYFNYRGAWGNPGQFSFKHCIEDVVNAVHYIEKEKVKLNVDIDNIILFGHSMGGWVTLKSVQRLPEIKKVFALSTWDIASTFKNIQNESELVAHPLDDFNNVFVLNTPYKNLFTPVIKDRSFYNIEYDAKLLATKKIFILDEHQGNEHIVNAIKKEPNCNVEYSVWETDHSFTNKRVSLMKKVLEFITDDKENNVEKRDSEIIDKWNHYIKSFEYADYPTIVERFYIPTTFSFYNKPSVVLSTREELVNMYKMVREKTIQPGYKYSLTDDIKIVWQSSSTCYADVVYSRYNNKYEKLATARGWYFFKKENDDWKLYEVRAVPF